jgi:hypothetical protein
MTGIIFCCLASTFGYSEQKSQKNQKYLDYPIEYLQLTGIFKGKPTPRILFDTNNLLYVKGDQGTVYCKIVKQTIEGNNINYYLSVEADMASGEKKKFLTIQFQLTVNNDDSCNYITYFRVKNMDTGEILEKVYDKTDSAESYGNLAGDFSGLAENMFDLNKVNNLLSKKSVDTNTSDSKTNSGHQD